MSLSSSSVALLSWICASATAAALRLGQNSFELAFNFVSQYTIGIPYQSYLHLWSLRYHQYLLFLFYLCGWDCVSLEVLPGIHVSIFSMHSLYIIVHIFIFSSIYLNSRLQWNLLFSHLFQESCCLLLIRLIGCRLQLLFKLILTSSSISSSSL